MNFRSVIKDENTDGDLPIQRPVYQGIHDQFRPISKSSWIERSDYSWTFADESIIAGVTKQIPFPFSVEELSLASTHS